VICVLWGCWWSTRYADLLTEAIERCMQAKRELTCTGNKGETANCRKPEFGCAATLALRDTLDLATGEPSHVNLLVEQVLNAERHGFSSHGRRTTHEVTRSSDDTTNVTV
jgi:hypothetical protein